MSDKVEALLKAAQEAERRCRRYGRAAYLLDMLSVALYGTALGTVTSRRSHVFRRRGWLPVFATGAALMVVGYAAYVMSGVYGAKATKAARQACVYRHVADVIAEIERIKAELSNQVEKLKQELKRREAFVAHAN